MVYLCTPEMRCTSVLVALVAMAAVALTSAACSTSTTHTLLVGPSRTYTTLESALAAARNLPFPRNVTISIAAPPSTSTPTLRLSAGIVLGTEDSCLVIAGEQHELQQQHQRKGSSSSSGGGSSSSMDTDHIRLDVNVPASVLEHVADSDTRISPSARGKVYRFKLSAVNAAQHATRWPNTWTQGDPHTRNLGVFWNGKRLEYARYPKATQNVTGSLCPHTPNGCEGKGDGCVGGIAMAAALAGTSKEWLAGQHKTPSAFKVPFGPFGLLVCSLSRRFSNHFLCLNAPDYYC